MQSGLQEDKETGRLEAFSDGVFGIAMTLLVLEIKVPHLSDLSGKMTLLQALRAQWPAYVAYVLSFVTILIMWMNHHKLFRQIHRSDSTLLLLNGLLLLAVTFVPFPTALLSDDADTVHGKTAALVYTGTYVVIAVLFNLLWYYVIRSTRLLARDHDLVVVRSITRQYRQGALL
jgi:uncharacterized membrane protein